MQFGKLAHAAAMGVTAFTALFLAWAIGALGVFGADGTPFDKPLLAVFATLAAGAAFARLRARPMGLALGVTAGVQIGVGVFVLATGRHGVHAPPTEVAMLTALFTGLWTIAALLFHWAAKARRALSGTS
jgi:hypothetical protein